MHKSVLRGGFTGNSRQIFCGDFVRDYLTTLTTLWGLRIHQKQPRKIKKKFSLREVGQAHGIEEHGEKARQDQCFRGDGGREVLQLNIARPRSRRGGLHAQPLSVGLGGDFEGVGVGRKGLSRDS